MLKYEYIVKELEQRINNNEFTSNKKLPTEEQLMLEYNVSRNTIRNAIKILMNLGIIYPVQGSGMFVRPPKKKGTVYLNSTRGVTADHPTSKLKNKVLHIEIIDADEELANRMNCDIGTPIYYLERLRIANNIPYAIEYTYYNKDIIPYLGKEIAEKSIFNYIKEDLKLSFGFADKYISADKLTKSQSELLELEENDPAIIIEDNIYLANGLLFNSSKIVYNYTLANFFTVTK